MTGLFGKIFGKKKDKKDDPSSLVEDVLNGIIEEGGFDLTYEINPNGDDALVVEFFGEDEELLKAREGQLLDALQLYVKRVVQHQLPDVKMEVDMDCDGFREQSNDALIELADKLRDIVLSKGKSVYFRALPPKDRKVIHQYLAEDGRVKSRSIGDGHFKKIKIYPAKGGEDSRQPTQTTD